MGFYSSVFCAGSGFDSDFAICLSGEYHLDCCPGFYFVKLSSFFLGACRVLDAWDLDGARVVGVTVGWQRSCGMRMSLRLTCGVVLAEDIGQTPF
jgi:hypothetical protein